MEIKGFKMKDGNWRVSNVVFSCWSAIQVLPSLKYLVVRVKQSSWQYWQLHRW